MSLVGTRIPFDERVTLLATAALVPQLLTDGEARMVLGFGLNEAAVDLGPYTRADLAVAARRAAAAILREHPLLDGEILERLGTPRTGSDLEIYAAALSRRPYARPDALATLLGACRPSSESRRRCFHVSEWSSRRECQRRIRRTTFCAMRPRNRSSVVSSSQCCARR